MHPAKEGDQGLGRHSVAVFGANHDFAFVFCTPEEKAEGACNVFFCGEFLDNLMQYFVLMES